MRRDDCSGFFETAQLQSDRSANNRRLPFKRRPETTNPIQPMFACPVEEFPARRVDRAPKRIVLPKYQADRAIQRKADLGVDVGKGRVRRKSHHFAAANVTYVIRSDRLVRSEAAVIVGRSHPNSDPRQPCYWLDPTKDLWRPKGSLIKLETR